MDKINVILQNLRNWNMILLTGNGARKTTYFRSTRSHNWSLVELLILKQHIHIITYYDVLLNNFRESHNF